MRNRDAAPAGRESRAERLPAVLTPAAGAASPALSSYFTRFANDAVRRCKAGEQSWGSRWTSRIENPSV
jgi:hypothetical protein